MKTSAFSCFLLLGMVYGLGACTPPGGGGNPEICDDMVDNDGNGQVDCRDTACLSDPICQPETLCDNGIDDDGDGQTDCDDANCAGDAACAAGVEDCGNGQDDDGDGEVDCADDDCAGVGNCGDTEVCDDDQDNDGDGDIDCDDADCVGNDHCLTPVEDCVDGVDNDSDGFIDCADPDCANDPACGSCTQVYTGDHVESNDSGNDSQQAGGVAENTGVVVDLLAGISSFSIAGCIHPMMQAGTIADGDEYEFFTGTFPLPVSLSLQSDAMPSGPLTLALYDATGGLVASDTGVSLTLSISSLMLNASIPYTIRVSQNLPAPSAPYSYRVQVN